MASLDIGIYEWIMRELDVGNIYCEIDGYWVWCPRGNHGFLNEYALSKMIEYLTAKNALWNWTINNDPLVKGSAPSQGGG